MRRHTHLRGRPIFFLFVLLAKRKTIVMLRKGAGGYGFGSSSSHELPGPNGSSSSGSLGGKKSSAARRRRLLSRLGIIAVALFLIVLVGRSRGKGAATTASLRGSEDVRAQHMKIEITAAAAEKR